MTPAGLQLLDTAFAVARDGRLLSVHERAPFEVFLPQLAALEMAAWHVAVPFYYQPTELARLLALARAHGVNIAALHDAASLRVAALDLPNTSLVLELADRGVAVSEVVADRNEVRRSRLALLPDIGHRELRRVWTELVAEAMVLKSRFDPLHDAASEQRLLAMLPDALRGLGERDQTSIVLPTGRGDDCSVVLSRDQFATAAAGIWRQIALLLRERRAAGTTVNIVLDEDTARLPGLRELLTDFVGCRCIVCPTGLAARRASLMALPVDSADGVALLRGHPRAAALESPEALMLTLPARRYQRPSHIVWSGGTVALPHGVQLEIGRAVGEKDLRLPEGLAGVSRLHCSICERDESLLVIDHSRYGIWLNDERVSRRAALRAGDRLRIGDPGVELNLIAIGAGDGAPQG